MPQRFQFSKKLLQWFDQHGRKNLPWQQPISPYRVWISEIMLQQTQVDTVIPYFERFMQRFPQLNDLAKADIDDVLHLWTGLGYYARARNLHKTAIEVSTDMQGSLPNSVDALLTLPGIGRSTAAAIASIAFEQSEAILDGNVKRVLARFHAIGGWPGKKDIENQLWQVAEQHMPKQRCRDYTQAMMDLGATLCTRSRPACERCPLQARCQAHAEGEPTRYPGKKPKKDKPTKHCKMLLIQNPSGEVLLYQRPSQGIWGGLWSLPELALEESAEDYVAQHYGPIHESHEEQTIKHVFSHYTLMISPIRLRLEKPSTKIMENNQTLWYNPHFPQELGLAAPVKKLLHG